MLAKTWEQDGKWGWSIFDEYVDEIASSTTMFDTREACREELHAALSDFE